jgi:hypothetical protein
LQQRREWKGNIKTGLAKYGVDFTQQVLNWNQWQVIVASFSFIIEIFCNFVQASGESGDCGTT